MVSESWCVLETGKFMGDLFTCLPHKETWEAIFFIRTNLIPVAINKLLEWATGASPVSRIEASPVTFTTSLDCARSSEKEFVQ